jgi:hypothetical protein
MKPKRDQTAGDRAQTRPEDTAMLSLSPEDRSKLNMDAWEPSLLRKLLTAQNKLKKRHD